MMRSNRGAWRVTSAALVMISGAWTLTSPSLAFAQPKKPAGGAVKPRGDAQAKAAAKKAYKLGEAKLAEGQYAEALDAFKAADDLLPIAKTKYKIAVCRDRLGRVLDAVAAYQTYLDSAPDPVKAADDIADAKARLDVLKKTPAKLHLLVSPATALGVSVTVDGGAPQPASALLVEIVAPTQGSPAAPYRTLVLPPGHHRVSVQAQGYEPSTQELDLGFADTKTITLSLLATPPPAPPPAPPPEPPPPAVVAEVPPPPPSKVPAYVSLGVAGAGLVLGATFGAVALKAKSNFNAAGGATTSNADAAETYAIASDASFGVAVALGVTGVVLLLNGGSAEPAKTAKAGVRGFVTPYAGPNGGGALGVLSF